MLKDEDNKYRISKSEARSYEKHEALNPKQIQMTKIQMTKIQMTKTFVLII